MSSPQIHIAIVGAGLGGLSAAISVAAAGHRATILEQAAQLGEVGLVVPTLPKSMTDHPIPGWSRNPDSPELCEYPQTMGNPRENRITFRPT